LLEQEVFCECGAWKNFLDLEESLSLDELIVLYEATVERQSRAMKSMAAASGAEISDDQSAIQYIYSDSDSEKSEERSYRPAALVDPKFGGEVTPAFGESEVHKLPINLGYSIIEGEQ
jgi:hypothetical protein